MSIMMDYIASAIVFGILLITIASIQVNINSTLYSNTFSVRVQGNAVQLALELEHDILKAGYHVSSGAVTAADSTHLKFSSDVMNTNSVTTIEYQIGETDDLTSTMNPNDFPFYRKEGSVQVTQNWGLTYFRFAYYDSLLNKLSTPVSSGNLSKIRAIQATFIIQSPEPVISNVDTTWPAVSWQKMMTPRNLGVLQ